MNAPRHLTVRDVPAGLARALKVEARRRRTSLNQTVKDLLSAALGLTAGAAYDNGLGAHAGTWSASDLRRFEESTRLFEDVDEELWR